MKINCALLFNDDSEVDDCEYCTLNEICTIYNKLKEVEKQLKNKNEHPVFKLYVENDK